MKTNLIKINNQSLEVFFDAEALYRYSKNAGNVEFLEGKNVDKDIAFATFVTLVWSMLKGKSAKKYPTPESLACLVYPCPSDADVESIVKIVQEDMKQVNEKFKKL